MTTLDFQQLLKCAYLVLSLLVASPALAQKTTQPKASDRTSDTIYACYENKRGGINPRGNKNWNDDVKPGALRRVSSESDCDPERETPLVWNVQGENGKDGTSPVGVAELPGSNCQYGGVKYNDLQGLHYVCNGAPGPQGPAGTAANVDALEERITALERATFPSAYVTTFDGKVFRIDSNNIVFGSIQAGGVLRGIGLSPSGSRVYVADNSGSAVLVIDTASNTVVTTIVGLTQASGIAVSPLGNRVYVTSVALSTVWVIDPSTNSVVKTIGGIDSPFEVTFNPSGTRAYVTSFNARLLTVFDTSNNTIVSTIPVGVDPVGVAVNPIAPRAYVANNGASSISIINTSNNTQVGTIAVGDGPYAVSFNPAGTRAYVTTLESTVSVIDTATNTAIANIPVGRAPFGIAVNPSGTRVYVASQSDSTVSVIDTSTNTVIATLTGFGGPHSIVFK